MASISASWRADIFGEGGEVIGWFVLLAIGAAHEPFGGDCRPGALVIDYEGALAALVVDQQVLKGGIAQEGECAGEVRLDAAGQVRANSATSPSGTKAANWSRASPDISLSMRWRRLTRQRVLYSRSRLAQMSSMNSPMVRVGPAGGSSAMSVVFLK